MLRTLLLYLSERRWLRRWFETSRAASVLTRRFVAGLTLDRGVEVCRRLNREGILVSLDHLGEYVTSEQEAEISLEHYLAALRRIAAEGLNASISIKLTQFGLNLSEDLCRRNVERLMEAANENHGFVEFDMESHPYVDATLRIVTAMHERYGCVRAVLQAYLYRTPEDAEDLCRRKIPVRLCKGAYREPPSVAYPRKSQVNRSFMRLTELLLEQGTDPGLATHDPRMIRHAIGHAKRLGLSKEAFEFQMLYGIRRDLQRSLVRRGYRLRLYVPYGDAWYPYLMRRLAERPANLLFVARNLLRR
ncbi:MAG: proline dehydrogenase family protein [Bryobacteraceae bacterium]|nr:proline dehydrogenase family protein [Bryobacteraceae bacterium]